MSVSSRTTFEVLPDEMILEICRYLHCSHVLYSFFDLNLRINQAITIYCQHLWLRRASYKQLLHIYESILPRIGSSILSLTVHPLHIASFAYESHISKMFPNLKMLTLTSWACENLLSFLSKNMDDMTYLQKLVIQELSCTSPVKNTEFIKKLFSFKNELLQQIVFDYDCDPFEFVRPSMNDAIQLNIRNLTIQLDKLTDLSTLLEFLPNLHRLDVSFKNSSLKRVPFSRTFSCLKELSIWAVHWYSHMDDLKALFEQVTSTIETLSVTLSTRDRNLIFGNKVLSILPSKLKQFNYTVCYYPIERHDSLNINMIKNSWHSLSVICAVNETDQRIFLHTLPYSSSRLIIRSSLAKNIPDRITYDIYSSIDRIEFYTMTNISDIFPMIRQCRRVRELTLSTTNEPTSSAVFSAHHNAKPMKLPYLNRLDILTIEGTPSSLDNFHELLIAAPNLCVLVIDLDCLLKLLEDENQPLRSYALLHQHILDLCVRIPESNKQNMKTTKLTLEKLHLIARIFTRVRNLTIDYEICDEYIEADIIKFVINEFKELVIFHIYGKIPSSIINTNIRQWVVEHSCFRIKFYDVFRVECSNQWFKLWL